MRGISAEQRARAFRLMSTGWSQGAAAEAVGCSKGTISGLVRRAGYSHEIIAHLARSRDIISLGEPKYDIYEDKTATPRDRRMKLIEANADLIGVDPKLVVSQSKSRPVTIARWKSYREMEGSGMSCAAIGRAFGRDHTGVLYGLAALHYIDTGEARPVLTKRGQVPTWVEIERSKRERPLSIEAQ